MTTIEKRQADIDSLRRQIRDTGYAVIPGAATAEQVQRARQACDTVPVATLKDENEIEATSLLRHQALSSLIFSRPTVALLKSLLGGTLAYYPNFVARLNRFTAWHVDNGFVPQYHNDAGHLYDENFSHLQCVIYLQDNQPGIGGGLDVRPQSHLWYRDGGFPGYEKLQERYDQHVSLDSRAGDLVVFDGRLMHRGTPTDGSLQVTKHGIFWSASRQDDVQTERYRSYLAGRSSFIRSHDLSEGDYEYMVRRYDDVHAVRFPDSFDTDTRQIIAADGIQIVEL